MTRLPTHGDEMSEDEREQVARLIRLAAALIAARVVDHSPMADAAKLMKLPDDNYGFNRPGPIRHLAQQACAAANNGFGLGCSDNIPATMMVAADAVESGRWKPVPPMTSPPQKRPREEPR